MIELFVIWLAAYIAGFLKWYIVPFRLEAPKLTAATPGYPDSQQRIASVKVGSVFIPVFEDRENKHVRLPRARDGTG